MNVGSAMSTAGIFTVPFDGVYLFSISGSSSSNDVSTYVDFRVDGIAVGGFIIRDNMVGNWAGDDYIPGSSQIVQRLKRGQTVDSFLRTG